MNPDMSAIAYIGSSRRRTRRKGLGTLCLGWLVVLAGLAVCLWLLRPMVPFLQAQQMHPTAANVERSIASLKIEGATGDLLAAEALSFTQRESILTEDEPSLLETPVPAAVPTYGVTTELVLQSYQSLGIDLARLVHADMSKSFRLYPPLWGSHQADPTVDHLRVPNLQRYLSRHGQELSRSEHDQDYRIGDLVVWDLPDTMGAMSNRVIGIVVPGPEARHGEPWVVTDSGNGPVWRDALFENEIVGHYRYAPSEIAMAGLVEP